MFRYLLQVAFPVLVRREYSISAEKELCFFNSGVSSAFCTCSGRSQHASHLFGCRQEVDYVIAIEKHTDTFGFHYQGQGSLGGCWFVRDLKEHPCVAIYTYTRHKSSSFKHFRSVSICH